MNVAIRSSRDDDVAAIAAIYRRHVLHGVASFEDIAGDEGEVGRRREDILALKLPYLGAEGSGRVVGYCYASRYRARSAYRFTLEDSIYVDAAEVGSGIGRALLSTLLDRCCELGYRPMVAVIGGRDRWPSIRLHEAPDFPRTGLLRARGFKLGGWGDWVLVPRSMRT